MNAPYLRDKAYISSDAGKNGVLRGFIAHFKATASEAVAEDTDGIHVALACTTPAIAASATVKAASALTDTLTIATPASLGAAGNVLKVLLTTAEDDTLAVTKTDETSTINIALAKTTATKNTATLIQAAIRTLVTVGGIDVSAIVCTAAGDWNTAAVATGEEGSVDFTGGQTAASDVVIIEITNPAIPRNITATAGGTEGDIKAIQVVVEGTNYNDEVITETLPAFTVNTAGTVTGSKAFKTVTKITIPAHDGTGATTAIGFGSKLGLPYKLNHNTCLFAFLDNSKEGTDPTVAVNATALESNTIALNSTLDGKVVDAYFVV